jgi:hypothetical protein
MTDVMFGRLIGCALARRHRGAQSGPTYLGVRTPRMRRSGDLQTTGVLDDRIR